MNTTLSANQYCILCRGVFKNGILGLSVSGAFELFYRQVILNNGLPFDVRLPNDVTQHAIAESRKGTGKKFNNTDDLFEDLGI